MATHANTVIDVGGTSIRLMRAGRGEPLLVLRGTDASDDWLPWMDRLAERFDVIVPEHPGFGARPLPPWLDKVSDLACFTLDLIDTLELSRVHLVGTSLGGWIAADLAMRSSQQLASLTLVGAAGLRLRGETGVDLFMMGEEEGLRARFHDQAAAERAAGRLLAAETEDVRLANAITIARVAWQPRLYDPQLEKWLHRVKVPTLIVWGEHDRVFPRSYALEWGRRIGGARVEIISDCGHAVALERPDVLVDTLIGFLSEQKGAR